jgi:hypothetical protein
MFYGNTFAQLIKIQNFIGRSQIDLINELGKPVHFDDSNPSMICMSYNLLSLKFLADQNGIYSAELTKNYTSEKEALDDIKDLISYSTPDGFLSDSISANKYILKKTGIQTAITLNQQNDSMYYELKIRAVRKTDK